MGKEKSPSGKSRANKQHAKHADKDTSQKKVAADGVVKQSKADSAPKQRLYPVIGFDNLLLFLYTCFVMWFGCTYQKLSCMMYCTEQWHFFDHTFKVLGNHFTYYNVERSLGRQLVFNTLRCMPEEVIMYLTYGK